MIVEWDNDWLLTTPGGELAFNQLVSLGTQPLGYYVLDRTRCSAGVGRRVTRTNLPQADGEILHRKFKTGYVLELNVQFWETIGVDGMPACGGLLREMAQLLDLRLNEIENDDGRIEWEPTAWPSNAAPLGERMVDKVRFLGPSGGGGDSYISVNVEHDPEGPLVTATFALLSPLPYAMDVTETTTTIASDGAATLDNLGNANFYPVMKVHGPATAFTITNESVTDEFGNFLEVVYDSTLPGAVAIAGGHYAEIDFFRETIYKDGNQTNLKAGIDVFHSDFFPLVPGPNVISVSAYGGTGVDILWQPAYV